MNKIQKLTIETLIVGDITGQEIEVYVGGDLVTMLETSLVELCERRDLRPVQNMLPLVSPSPVPVSNPDEASSSRDGDRFFRTTFRTGVSEIEGFYTSNGYTRLAGDLSLGSFTAGGVWLTEHERDQVCKESRREQIEKTFRTTGRERRMRKDGSVIPVVEARYGETYSAIAGRLDIGIHEGQAVFLTKTELDAVRQYQLDAKGTRRATS
jgi:hypothetical protein